LVIVDNGAITLEKPFSTILVGVPYASELETVPYNQAEFSFGAGPKTSIGQQQRINRVQLDLFETGSAEVGLSDGEFIDPQSFRNVGHDWGVVEPLFTGIVDISVGGHMQRETSVIINSKDPVPFTLRGIVMDGQYTSD
jgi:hypothetical protein